jgi:hypothetical protein
MCAVTSVSRKWRDVMAKEMWEGTTTSLQPSSTKDFDALLHPQSGLLNHVRYFNIEDMEDGEESDERLRTFLTAVPEDRLREFDSTTDLSVSTLRTLLQRQRCLSRLNVVDLAKLIEAGEDATMEPALASVTDYIVTVPKRDAKDESEEILYYTRCRKIINSLENLKELRIKNDYKIRTDDDLVNVHHLFRGEDGDVELCRLTEFVLDGINVATSTTPILRHINLSILRTLYLYNVLGVADLLNGLSKVYAKQAGPLDRLAIELGWDLEDTQETKTAVTLFLNTCPKLAWLLLDLIHHFVVDLKCIIRHADTLNYLYLNVGDWPKRPAFLFLEFYQTLVHGCPNLTMLNMNIPPADLGELPELGEDWRLGPGRFDVAHVAQDFETYLVRGSHVK